MADKKVSGLPLLGSGSLDPAADFLLIADVSAALSKKIKPSGLFSGALPFAEPVFDFTKGTLPSGVSFARASTGYRYNSFGVLVSEATDVARFDYSPAALTLRGLLIEGAGTNLVRQSADRTTTWASTRATRTANVATAPDGTVAMGRLTEDASATNNHFTDCGVFSTTSGVYYVASVYAKAETRSWFYILLQTNFAAFTRTWFNVTAGAGAIGTTGGGVVANFIEDVGVGIYRCTVIAPATATGGSASVRLGLASADGITNYTGDGTSSILFWGADCQASDAVLSHVPTTTASVTRAQDTALITNSLVLTDRCWVIRARTPRRVVGSSTPTVFQVDDGSESNRLLVRYADGGTLNAIATVAGATQCNIATAAVAADTDFTVSVRWADNNFAVSLNGGAIITDLAGTVPANLTAARAGRGFSTGYWNSTIKTIETRRTATDAELVLLSS